MQGMGLHNKKHLRLKNNSFSTMFSSIEVQFLHRMNFSQLGLFAVILWIAIISDICEARTINIGGSKTLILF